MWRRAFRALTTTVEIHLDSDTLVPALVAITGSYPGVCGPASLHYAVQGSASGFRILREEQVIEEGASAMDVPSILELDMLRSCVALAVDHVVLHAAAVTFGTGTLVMVGRSGSGKTTLTRALLDAGALYRTDECVAISADRQVHGLARPIHLSEDPDESIDASQVHQHRWLSESDAVVCDQVWHPPAAQGSMPAGLLVSLVLVSYAPDSPAQRVALTSGEALARLWPCVLNPSPSTLDVLVALIEARPVFAVQSDSLASGCTLVRRGLA